MKPLKYMEDMGVFKEDATEIVNLGIKSLQSKASKITENKSKKNKQPFRKGFSKSKNSCFFMEN